MIVFDSIWKAYRKELFKPSPSALQGVSFWLPRGKTLGLIGANGAGKSTSIRLIMDFIRPDKGRISLFDGPVSDIRRRSLIGYLPESSGFNGSFSIVDIINFTASTCCLTQAIAKERSELLLRELGLWEVRHKRLRTYSKGMQQRANFVLALLNDPELLILDEPMSGLDPLGRGQIIDLIQRLKEQGKTILFCSHILADVDRLVDQLLVLHRGSVLFNGSPDKFLEQQEEASIEKAFLSLINRHSGTCDAA